VGPPPDPFGSDPDPSGSDPALGDA
jgi:hypothetical protein